jgi:6-phosphogluconate dehydrogenase
MKELSDIAVVGLAVMGENLILNMESKGFTVTAYNRSTEKVDRFINGRAKEKTSVVPIQLKKWLNHWPSRAK